MNWQMPFTADPPILIKRDPMIRIYCLIWLVGMAINTSVLNAEVPASPAPSLAPVLERVLPGMVSVAVEGKSTNQDVFSNAFLRRFFGLPNGDAPQEQVTEGAGSGVVIDAEEGYILTNNHLIQDADGISVILSDGRQFEAEKVGTDSFTDLAVLKIQAEKLIAAPLGHSDQLRVGDYVIAVGNPFGLNQTVTMGIVSALGRSGLGFYDAEDFIQTDASINPGNSGGALLNISGEVVGINSAILAPAGTNVGIGFAVPINMAREIAIELIAKGEIRRGQLGVILQNLTPELAKALETDASSGAVITQVISGSPAEQAELLVGDVITEIDGESIKSGSAVTSKVSREREGDTIRIALKRKKILRNTTAVLAIIQVAKVDFSDKLPLLSSVVMASAETGGAVVLEVDNNSPAGQAGLKIGDVILGVNLNSISSPVEIVDLARQRKDILLLQVAREGSIRFIPVAM